MDSLSESKASYSWGENSSRVKFPSATMRVRIRVFGGRDREGEDERERGRGLSACADDADEAEECSDEAGEELRGDNSVSRTWKRL